MEYRSTYGSDEDATRRLVDPAYAKQCRTRARHEQMMAWLIPGGNIHEGQVLFKTRSASRTGTRHEVHVDLNVLDAVYCDCEGFEREAYCIHCGAAFNWIYHSRHLRWLIHKTGFRPRGQRL